MKNMDDLEVKNKKVKVKKIKTHSATKSLTGIFISLFITMAIFGGLIYLNNYISEDISYKQTVVAIANIPENLCITKDNASEYFAIKSRDITTLPEDYINSLENYENRYISTNISKNEVITSKDFKTLNDEKFSSPVEVSLAVNNLGNAICGKLRAGDVINITINLNTNNVIGKDTKKYENIVVTGAYDSSCTLIEEGDTEANAAYITFNIEKSEEDKLNEALIDYSSIRVSRKAN